MPAREKKKKIDVSSLPKPGDVMETSTSAKLKTESAQKEVIKNKPNTTKPQSSSPQPKKTVETNNSNENKNTVAAKPAVSPVVSDNSIPEPVKKEIPSQSPAVLNKPSEQRKSTEKPEKKETKENREVEGFGIKPREEEEESDIIPLERSNKRLYVASIIVFILVVGTTIAAFFYRTKLNTEDAEVAEEVVAQDIKTEEAEVEFEEIEFKEASSASKLEPSEIAIEILNGSGVAGLAASVSAQFEELGYEIESVGNSQRQDKNTLHIESSKSAELKELIDDAEELLGITDTLELEDGDGILGRIILGSE